MPTASLSSVRRTKRPSADPTTSQTRSELTNYTVPPRAQFNDQGATYARNMFDRDQSPTRTALTHREQSVQNASEINNLKSVLRSDFQAVTSSLRASKRHYEDLNARFVAADKEHTNIANLVTAKLSDENKVSSLMAAQLLAEADGKEYYARRLRERVNLVEQRINEGPQMLQLTASPDTSHHEIDGAFELDAGQAATQMFNGSETSEDTAYTEPGLQQSEPAMNEQQSPKVGVVQFDDEQAHQIHSVEEAKWLPHTIAQLTPLDISSPNNETFTWEELFGHFGGSQYSPGLYYSRNDSPSRLLQGHTYWLLEGNYEPFAPTSPGQHGAKLTAFFNDSLTPQGDIVGVEDYLNVPVFVCLKPGEGYTYMGQYSQPRYSDKLSYSEIFQHVPTRVLEYWAKQLADPHRPAWITEQLVAHFWPPPPYTGPIPTDSALTSPATGVTAPNDLEHVLEKRVSLALERYAVELKAWKKDAQMKVTLLTEKALMEAWDNSDTDEEKGLRLWWEYLECIGFDDNFYGKLVGLKKAQQQRGREAATVTGIVDLSTCSGDVAGMQSKRSSKHQRHDSFASSLSAGASTVKPIKPKEPTLARSNRPAPIAVPGAYPQADLQVARELHEKATKAGDRKRGTRNKQQALPLRARGVKK
ncbi:hypothetical protein MBLNU13_g02808t2 [Cladosporium sp. NU13]